MTTEASDTKELAFKDLRPGQAIYLRTTKDVAKLFSTNDTIQGFQILMVTNEDLKEAGLPVTRRRLTVKSMVDENLWEINVIPETTMVITPTSTGVVDPHILDGLRKGISPIAFHKLSDEEIQAFNKSFGEHRSVPEVDSELSQQEDEENDSDGYGIPRGGNANNLTLYPGRFEEDRNASSQINTSTPLIPNTSAAPTDPPNQISNQLQQLSGVFQTIQAQINKNNDEQDRRFERLFDASTRSQQEAERRQQEADRRQEEQDRQNAAVRQQIEAGETRVKNIEEGFKTLHTLLQQIASATQVNTEKPVSNDMSTPVVKDSSLPRRQCFTNSKDTPLAETAGRSSSVADRSIQIEEHIKRRESSVPAKTTDKNVKGNLQQNQSSGVTVPGSVSFATNTRTFIQPPGPSEISDDSDEGSNCPENMASWCAHNIEEDYLIKKYDESSKSKGKFPENKVPHEALKEREDYENNAVLYRKLYLKTRPTVKETETFWKLVDDSRQMEERSRRLEAARKLSKPKRQTSKERNNSGDRTAEGSSRSRDNSQTRSILKNKAENIGDKMQFIMQQIESTPTPIYSKSPTDYFAASKSAVEEAITSKYKAIAAEGKKLEDIAYKESALIKNLRKAVMEDDIALIDSIKWDITEGRNDKNIANVHISSHKDSIRNAVNRLNIIEENEKNKSKKNGKAPHLTDSEDEDDLDNQLKSEFQPTNNRNNINSNSRNLLGGRSSSKQSRYSSDDDFESNENIDQRRRSRRTERRKDFSKKDHRESRRNVQQNSDIIHP